MKVLPWFLGVPLALCSSPRAFAITADPFGSFGEGGCRNGQELTIGSGGEVFELDAFLKVGAADSMQLSVDPLPAAIEYSFSPTLSGDSTDLALRYSFTNRGDAAITRVLFLSYLDAEIDEQVNTFSNEYAEIAGDLGSGAGDADPDAFEVDEAGFTFGDIISNLFAGALDNTNAIASGSPECVAMALAFDLGTLLPDERVDVTIVISEDRDERGSFSITQSDADERSTTTITYSGELTRTLTSAPRSFRRGDFDNDTTIESGDAEGILDYLLAGGPESRDCFGDPQLETADANDNESITVADYLAARAAAAGRLELRAPFPHCDPDPDDDPRGFDRVDSDFVVSAGDVVIDPATGATDRDVFVPVLLDVAADVTGFTLILEFDPNALTPFDPSAGDAPPFETDLGSSDVKVTDDSIVITVWAERDGELVLEGMPGTLQRAGTVAFHLEDFVILRPFFWAEEEVVDSRLFRSTVVDSEFDDHHPSSFVDGFAFVRGNSDSDAQLNITDPIFTLNFLFLGGSRPNCMDALDADDDSQVNITDPVFTLNFLFIGGPRIPQPYPQCGLDQTTDLLGCSPCSCPPYPAGDPCAE